MFWRKGGNKGKRGEPMPARNEGRPDSNAPSGLCPRCETQSSFDEIGFLPLTFDGGELMLPGGSIPTYDERVAVLRCRHCSQGVVVLEEQFIGGKPKRENRGGGTISWHGFHWWPLAGSTAHRAVPPAIGSAYHEAALCVSANCPRAAAVMARRTLEAIAADKGETEGVLADRLKRLAKSGVLHPTLADWSKEVRLIGNFGAHYDPLNDVSLEDAQQLLSFIRELMKYLYVLPFELNERRSPKPQI